MRLTTTIIDRALLVVVAAVALVSVLSVGVDLVQHGPLLRADPAVLVVTAAIVLAAVWTLVDFAVGRVRSRAAQAYTLGGLIGTPLILLPWAPSATTLSTPEVLLRLTWPAVICSAVLLRRGIRATVVFAVIIYLMRRPTVGSGAAALEATLYANGLLAAHLGISMVRSAARAVEDSSARIWLARTREARAQQVLLEREEWRSLIHDKVLGALQLVSRRPSPQRDQLAAGLAAEALADLRGRATGGDRDVGDRVASAAHRLGLSVDVDIDGACPQDFVADALADATEAALTNTAWHAGVTSAVVWARFTDDTAQVLVRDSGVGFEPRAVPADRLGISQGIVRRMAAVGGDATVVSTPGAGTSVTLRWQRPRVRIPSTEDSPGWSPRYRRLAVIIGTVMTLGHCLVGATRWWEYDPPAWVPFAIVSAVTLTVLTVFAPVRWRVVPIVAIAGTAVTMSLLTSTLIEPLIPDWRYWFVGAHYVLGDARAALASVGAAGVHRRRHRRVALLGAVAGAARGGVRHPPAHRHAHPPHPGRRHPVQPGLRAASGRRAGRGGMALQRAPRCRRRTVGADRGPSAQPQRRSNADAVTADLRGAPHPAVPRPLRPAGDDHPRRTARRPAARRRPATRDRGRPPPGRARRVDRPVGARSTPSSSGTRARACSPRPVRGRRCGPATDPTSRGTSARWSSSMRTSTTPTPPRRPTPPTRRG